MNIAKNEDGSITVTAKVTISDCDEKKDSQEDVETKKDDSVTVTAEVTISDCDEKKDSQEDAETKKDDDNKISHQSVEEKQEKKKHNFLLNLKGVSDTMELLNKENPAAVDNFYYIYSALREIDGNLHIKLSRDNRRDVTISDCQVSLPNLQLTLQGEGQNSLDSLTNLTTELRPIVDKFSDDKKAVDSCSVM